MTNTHLKTDVLRFFDKLYTKQWLNLNTTFSYPKIALLPDNLKNILNNLNLIPDGLYVLKPKSSRMSSSVVLFEKINSFFNFIGDKKYMVYEEAKQKISCLVQDRKSKRDKCRLFFVEEWIIPNEQLKQFTVNEKCPPCVRIVGKPEIHFVCIGVMLDDSTGIAGAHWQDRKYLWLDLEGRIRHKDEMNLKNTDAKSIEIARKKSYENVPVGLKIEKLKEVIDKINIEIAPKITLYKNKSWSCDGVFNAADEFIIIEMNHSPGHQFRGFSWID